MFDLFSKKVYNQSITPEDKEWVENNFIWFIETFGLDRLRNQPFILPTIDNFPYNDFTNDAQFQAMFEKLCKYWEVAAEEITVSFFEDVRSKQWTTWAPAGGFKEQSGYFLQTGEKSFTIELATSNLQDPQLLIATLAHELAHVKLLGGNYVNADDPDMEPLTDLATIFFGFGLFVANICNTNGNYWFGRSGYLPNPVISYSNALVCYVTGNDANAYLEYLNSNTNDLFANDYQFLVNTHNTLLSADGIARHEAIYLLNKQVSDGFDRRNYDAVIEAASLLFEADQNNYEALNNIGYALLQQKKYNEAIKAFTQAIELDPYWDFLYNNRGYCLLQLGEIDSAFIDLHKSFEMNPDNSYSWRNLGVYYLVTGQGDLALHHLKQAHKLDIETELINFYLSKAYGLLGNRELATQYLAKSTELNEHNDSSIVESITKF